MIAPQMLPSDLVVPTKPGWRIDIGDAGSAASPKPWHCASSRRSACVRPVSPRGKSLVRISARCVLSPVAPLPGQLLSVIGPLANTTVPAIDTLDALVEGTIRSARNFLNTTSPRRL